MPSDKAPSEAPAAKRLSVEAFEAAFPSSPVEMFRAGVFFAGGRGPKWFAAWSARYFTEDKKLIDPQTPRHCAEGETPEEALYALVESQLQRTREQMEEVHQRIEKASEELRNLRDRELQLAQVLGEDDGQNLD